MPPYLFSILMRLTTSSWEVFAAELRKDLEVNPGKRRHVRGKHSKSRLERNRRRRLLKFYELARPGQAVPKNLLNMQLNAENLRILEIESQGTWTRPVHVVYKSKLVDKSTSYTKDDQVIYERPEPGRSKASLLYYGKDIEDAAPVSKPVKNRYPTFGDWRRLDKPEGTYRAYLISLGIDPDNPTGA
jgi:hypothetical protein